jgi:hypothetical protein
MRIRLSCVTALLFIQSWVLCVAADSPRFVAPTNEHELSVRLDELRQQYAPYLRSLPPPLPGRERTLLPAAWKFTFEAKEKPKVEVIPPAPPWEGVGFDDAGWDTTTVPEWRYRTRLSDTALNPDQKAQWKNPPQLTADTICWYRTTFAAVAPPAGDRLWLCFDGVEWEAQVFLNGELLGKHIIYYEPFRFDVTDRVRGTNTLAVRVIAGRSYGQPMTYWGVFPDIRAAEQRYVPDRAQSIRGNLPIGYHAGGGFGIHRAVYLERSGPVRIGDVFARNDLSAGRARVQVELDSAEARSTEMRVEILPENYEGSSFSASRTVEVAKGLSVHELEIPMPDARVWSPESPNLYRCRVTMKGADAKDVLFGCRSFSLVHREAAAPAAMPTYTFPPVRARWLRIVGRASDASTWNSIWEVDSPALVRDGKAVTASKSHHDYPAALALDGKMDTRWAEDGRGEWIQFPLDEQVPFDRVSIGWFEAESRAWDFDLLVSTDGQAWTKLAYQPPPAPAPEKRDGLFKLNGKPAYLRGTNIQGLNAYWYWGQTNELLHALLLLKAANFNAVRSCQHVEFPEVLEWMDRVGMMSEQDQGGGYAGSLDMGIRREPHIRTGTVLARQTYNHPGVVLLTFGNEHDFPTEPIVRAALAVDPQRIFKPISGRFTHTSRPWDLPADLRASAVDDGHPYSGWYGGNVPQTWKNLQIFSPRRLVTLGEYGAEAMDAYETMRDHYPPQFQPPPPDADTLWASAQVQKHDVKQIAGLGRNPTNLAEYIEASQGYQAALMADKTIGMRLSPRAIGGYFQFHFLDVVPVFWPKSIVSHDQRPKLAYYQMAQVNQPVVALPQFTGERPDAVTLWVANDLDESFAQATLSWTVNADGRRLREGKHQLDVPAIGAVRGETVDLADIAREHPVFDVELTVSDAGGHLLSRYRRTVCTVPASLLKADPAPATEDPFNKKKEPAK